MALLGRSRVRSAGLLPLPLPAVVLDAAACWRLLKRRRRRCLRRQQGELTSPAPTATSHTCCSSRSASRTPRRLCSPRGARPSCSARALLRRTSGACTVRAPTLVSCGLHTPRLGLQRSAACCLPCLFCHLEGWEVDHQCSVDGTCSWRPRLREPARGSPSSPPHPLLTQCLWWSAPAMSRRPSRCWCTARPGCGCCWAMGVASAARCRCR